MISKEAIRRALALCALVAAPLFNAHAETPPEATTPDQTAPTEWREPPPADLNSDRHIAQPWQGDIVDFHVRDFAYWRTGYWIRELHEGRGGWWWVVGDTWYPYPHVVYPYPDPYTPPNYEQPRIIGQEPYPPHYLYYCVSADNYYPYVASCPEGWTPARVIRRLAPP